MCRLIISNQSAYLLEAALTRLPHTPDINLQLIQTFPQARRPTCQVVFNATLPREDLKILGRLLCNET